MHGNRARRWVVFFHFSLLEEVTVAHTDRGFNHVVEEAASLLGHVFYDFEVTYGLVPLSADVWIGYHLKDDLWWYPIYFCMCFYQNYSRSIVCSFQNINPVTGCPSLLPGPLGLIFGNAHQLGKILIDDFYFDLLVSMRCLNLVGLVEIVPGMRLLKCGI